VGLFLRMVELHQLIYRSEASACVGYRELTQILRVSRCNNRQRGITGLLLADENGFLQVLEGDAAAVKELFRHLSADPRHKNVVLIRSEALAKRCFARWNMRGVGLFSFNDQLRAELARKYNLLSRGAPFELDAEEALALLCEVAATVDEEKEASLASK
jgi:hypothetical protein